MTDATPTADPRESGADKIPVEVMKKILLCRDAIIAGDVNEAYHQLYSIASPNFDEYEPWDKFQKQWKRSRPQYIGCRCKKCGWIGSGEEAEGGQPIADTGDFGDITCPICVEDGYYGQLLVDAEDHQLCDEIVRLRKALTTTQRELAEARGRVEGVRPEVLAFAHLMESKLKKNDHKGGWKNCDPSWLFNRMYEEIEEIKIPLLTDKNEQAKRRHEQRDRISLECADVANFAMMIADVCGIAPTPAPPAKET